MARESGPFPLALCLKQDFWLKVLKTGISDADLFERLGNYWTEVGSISGLIAGFTYIVTSSGDIVFTQDGVLKDHRIDIFGLLSMSSFILSLFSSILAAFLFGTVNSVGVGSAKWFVMENWWMIDLPFKLCVAGVFCLLLSALVSFGGIVSSWCFWIIVSFTIAMIVMCVFIVNSTLRQSYDRITSLQLADKQASQHSSADIASEEEHLNVSRSSESHLVKPKEKGIKLQALRLNYKRGHIPRGNR